MPERARSRPGAAPARAAWRALRRAPAAAALLVGLGAALAIALAAGGDSPARTGPASVPYDGRSPLAPEGPEVRVLFALGRPSLGERMAVERLPPARQRAHVRSLHREAEALRSALAARAVRLRDVTDYGRVWNGFAATIRTEDLPRVQTLAVRVEPVRRFYPATAPGAALAQAQAPGAGTTPQGGSPGEAPDGEAADGEAADGEPADGEPPSAPGDAARGEPDPLAGAGGDEPRALRPGHPGGSVAARGTDAVALLDSGVDMRHPALRGRVAPLADLVERDEDPSPGRAGRRRDEHGTQVAGLLVRALGGRGRVLAIRVAGLERDRATGVVDEVATTDRVLDGLERAVDPDRDGDAEDAVPVALSGVSSPYAGFGSSPEARAAGAAAALGTLLVAPAGNEGAPGAPFGTVGSPGAAPAALAVGALEGGGAAAPPRVRLALAAREGRATLDATLLGGPPSPLRAPATGLSGPSQRDPRARGRSTGADPLDYYAADARPRARGRVVVVPAADASGRRPPIAAIAAAASGAGALALVVCDPARDDPPRPISRAAAAGIPVLGLSGGNARRALELTAEPGALAFVSGHHERTDGGAAHPSASSSRGPTYSLTPKPDLLAGGTAIAPVAGGGSAYAGGTSVAAAHAAAEALALRRARPRWGALEAAAALATTAPAGVPRAAAAAAAPALALPRALTLALPPSGAPAGRARATLALANPGRRALRMQLAARVYDASHGASLTVPRSVVVPAGGRARVEVVARAARGGAGAVLHGSVEARAGARVVRVPVALAVGAPPPAPLAELRLVRDGGRVRGVRFGAGAVRRAGGRVSVLPLAALALTLETPSGRVVRELTPPGGARDLLPAEYAYTLTGETLREIPDGDYVFVARAAAPAGGARAERRSEEFEVR